MKEHPIRRFHYHAAAHALSGRITRPIAHMIEVQAPASLPTLGGHGTSRVDNFRLKELVSFRSAYSHVSGSEQSDHDKLFHTTLVTSTVEGLNILDVVTADRVVARLSSSYEFSEDEPRIIHLGSTFENLRVVGCPVKVDFHHDLFLKLDTFDTMRSEFKGSSAFRKIAEDPFRSGHKQKPPEAHGVLLCSLVQDIQTTCPGVTCEGHAIVVPKFGKIFVGEVVAEHGRRTLTMLRLELGSPVAGDGVVAQVTINGHHWP